MYTIAVCPVTQLEDAFDLRPLVKYEAEDANLIGADLKTDTLSGKIYVKYTKPTDETIAWTINIGVAGKYSLKFRYINATENVIPMNISITDANGILLNNEIIEFSGTTADKWQSLTTTTGTMINAGTYKVKLSSTGKEGLSIDVLEVQ